MKQKVYLLPGTMCNERLWHKLFTCAKADSNSQYQKPQLDNNIEFIHVPIPANKSFEQLAIWLNEFFQEEKVYILGFSLGGYIASYFAVNYPNRIKGLFIVGNSPCTLAPQDVSQRQELLNFIHSGLSTSEYKGISDRRAKQLLNSATYQQQDILTIKQMDAELGTDELISQMTHTTERDDLLKPLVKLKSNIIFYYSEDDPLVNLPWLRQLESNNSNCYLVSTNGNGHMLPLEKPEELLHHLHNFLLN